MKKSIFLLLLTLCFSLGSMAQTAADKICGTYHVVQNGNVSKVKIFKHGAGYRAQVCWLQVTKNPDGTLRTDHKNPDVSKRNTPADQIVIIDNVTYDNGTWSNGHIYDPTCGKTYKVEVTFKDAKTLQVKGKLGPFSKNMYWTKLA